MALSWVSLDVETDTQADFTLTQTTEAVGVLQGVSPGFLLRVRLIKTGTLSYGLSPTMALIFAPSLLAVPSSLDWTEQDSLTETNTFSGFESDFITKVYYGIPKDGSGNPLGSDRFYLIKSAQYINDNPIFFSLSLAITPPTFDEVLFNS